MLTVKQVNHVDRFDSAHKPNTSCMYLTYKSAQGIYKRILSVLSSKDLKISLFAFFPQQINLIIVPTGSPIDKFTKLHNLDFDLKSHWLLIDESRDLTAVGQKAFQLFTTAKVVKSPFGQERERYGSWRKLNLRFGAATGREFRPRLRCGRMPAVSPHPSPGRSAGSRESGE